MKDLGIGNRIARRGGRGLGGGARREERMKSWGGGLSPCFLPRKWAFGVGGSEGERLKR